jgi:hypothetical protein
MTTCLLLLQVARGNVNSILVLTGLALCDGGQRPARADRSPAGFSIFYCSIIGTLLARGLEIALHARTFFRVHFAIRSCTWR